MSRNITNFLLAAIVGVMAALTVIVFEPIFAKSDTCVDGNPVISVGSSEQCGSAGPAGPVVMGTPNTRSFSLATAYQATDPTKIAIVTITISSSANFSLTGGTTNTATIVIGPTNAVSSGTGYVIGNYSNSVTGTIAIGLNQNSVQTTSYTINLPVGWYFAVRQSSGTVTIPAGWDQGVG